MRGHDYQLTQELLLLSHFSHVRLCVTPQTAAHQDPPSLGFSRQDPGARLRQSEAPHLLPVFGMNALPTIPTVGAVFMDVVLRE